MDKFNDIYFDFELFHFLNQNEASMNWTHATNVLKKEMEINDI